MALTPEEIAIYTANLEAAEKAYHSLMIGGAAVEFTDQNGEKIRYSSANRTALLTYIQQLRNMLGMCPFLGNIVCRPAGVIF